MATRHKAPLVLIDLVSDLWGSCMRKGEPFSGIKLHWLVRSLVLKLKLMLPYEPARSHSFPLGVAGDDEQDEEVIE